MRISSYENFIYGGQRKNYSMAITSMVFDYNISQLIVSFCCIFFSCYLEYNLWIDNFKNLVKIMHNFFYNF